MPFMIKRKSNRSFQIKFSYLLVVGLILIVSCNEQDKNEQPKKRPPTQEELFEINKQLMTEERVRIEHFIKRKGWPVKSSGTGLKYWVYEQTDGDSIHERDIVNVEYVITLMTGDTCYVRDENPESFTVDFDEVESGLHEGIKYMKRGEKAKLILPPHLAHGLVGDLNKIPMNATLIYDIHILAK